MRITYKLLEKKIRSINIIRGKEQLPLSSGSHPTVPKASFNIGSWYLDYATPYGGYVVNEVMNDQGGCRNPLGYDRVSASIMMYKLNAFEQGFQEGRNK